MLLFCDQSHSKVAPELINTRLRSICHSIPSQINMSFSPESNQYVIQSRVHELIANQIHDTRKMKPTTWDFRTAVPESPSIDKCLVYNVSSILHPEYMAILYTTDQNKIRISPRRPGAPGTGAPYSNPISDTPNIPTELILSVRIAQPPLSSLRRPSGPVRLLSASL